MDAARYHVVNDPVDADSWVQPAIEQEKTLKVSFDPPYLGWNEPHDTVVAFISTQLELDLSEALVYQTHLNGSAIFIETKDPIPEHVRSGMFGQLTLGQRQHTMLKLDISYMGNPKIKVVLDNIPRRMPLEIVAKELQKAIRSETRTDLLREAPTVRRERHHRADQASAILNITEDAVPFIPHFITVGYAADTARGQQQRTSRITLRIRGRRQVCATCGKLGHFSGSKKCAVPLAPEEMGPPPPPPPTRPTADAAIQPLMDLNLPPPSKLPKKHEDQTGKEITLSRTPQTLRALMFAAIVIPTTPNGPPAATRPSRGENTTEPNVKSELSLPTPSDNIACLAMAVVGQGMKRKVKNSQ